MSERVETVVVGGGQAGLALSSYLQARGHEHVVLERGRVVERWRSERWDSLHFQFPNWTLRLPGFAYRGPEPDAFSPCADVVRFLDEYAAFVKPPLRTGVAVERVTRKPGSSRLLVQTADATFEAANVVLATGPYQRARQPAWSGKLPSGIVQLHSTEYRNPDQFPPGAVLVVGSGASGSQIVEELITRGRRVFLSVGRHRRYPRRYRGRDLYWWLEAMGVVDQTVEDHPELKGRPLPLITGIDGGHDVDLRDYAAAGVTLLGHLDGADGARIAITPDVSPFIADGDASLLKFVAAAEAHVQRVGGGFPESTLVPPGPPPRGDERRTLDLFAESISSVLWTTGFAHDFGFVDAPGFAQRGEPVQRRGVTAAPGLFVLGLPWMHTLKSSVLCGVGDDAAYLAERIAVGGAGRD